MGDRSLVKTKWRVHWWILLVVSAPVAGFGLWLILADSYSPTEYSILAAVVGYVLLGGVVLYACISSVIVRLRTSLSPIQVVVTHLSLLFLVCLILFF